MRKIDLRGLDVNPHRHTHTHNNKANTTEIAEKNKSKRMGQVRHRGKPLQ